ncbi:MAG TPA: type IV secretion system DNA-binding domain-containing protein [Verrucomicrobiae bacterium]|nr:type IV secretion system DNA-binding domain-containing protein [Verrucomicrobiae bacterium]
MVELQASLPDKLDVSKEAFEQFLLNLSLCREPVAFELVGSCGRVCAQFAACESDISLARKQLSAHFPDVQFRQQTGTLETAWLASQGDEAFAVEFGLEREFMLPLATSKLDPFVGIVAALAELQPGELALFQVLFQPVENPWAESIVNSVTHADGKPFFVDSPELAGAAENKVARPLYAAVVRIMGRTASRERLYEIARDLAGALRVFGSLQGNALIPLHNEEYPFEEHIEDVIARQSRRSGMILNSDELVNFVHLPSSAVRSLALLRDTGRTKAAPAIVQQPPGVVIGDNEHNGETVPVFLTADQRVRHTHIIGSSGCGKSSLLLNLIRQDIENGDGVAVLDPHGDLIDQILTLIPVERIDDVVLVNPSDVEFPIGFNILQAHSEVEKNLLSSDLVSVFRRLSTSWGDQMDTVLQNAILVFLESSRGGTLAELRRFLLEPPFRSEFLQTVHDPELIYYWQKVFPQLGGGKSIGSVLTRLQDFFSRKPLRNMVSQRENKLDFADIMDSGKIFLAKLSEGLCGAENSYLLGTLLVSKFQQLAMARQAQQMAVRRDFWLYVDEFDHFISPSMAEILKGARKYRLGLTLAHQELHQLQSEPKVASAVMTQPCTRIVFRVGDDDAKKLGDGFTAFDAKSLKTLEKFHAIVRVERNDFDFNLALRKPELEAVSDAQAIIAASRAKYATPRAEVEAALLASLRGEAKKPAPPESVAPPSSETQPAPKPVSPPTAASNVVPPAPPAGAVEVPPPSPPPVPPPITVSEKESVKTVEPKDLGRGGARHTAIQDRLKTEAQKLGFRAEVEKQLAKGSNDAADLLLRRGSIEIAVEISITTGVDHEFENVKKCLASGIGRVAVVATGRKQLENIAASVQGGLGPEAAAKVSYNTPDEFLAELQKLAKTAEEQLPSEPMPKTDKILGFKITRNFQKQSPEAQQLNQQAIHDVTLRAMKQPTSGAKDKPDRPP